MCYANLYINLHKNEIYATLAGVIKMDCKIDMISGNTPIHKHDNYEIIVYVKGQGVFCTGENIDVSPGKIIVIPPRTEHSVRDADDLTRIFIDGPFQHIFSTDVPIIVTDSRDGEGLHLAEMIYRNRYAKTEYLTALINAFLYFLLEKLDAEDGIHLRIKKIIRDISENFHDSSIDLQEILKKSGYSVDYIRGQFRRIMGKTPTEFLTELRIHRACYLMDIYANIVSLSEIAEKCGFTDYVYFSRQFKQIMKVSPRQYIGK